MSLLTVASRSADPVLHPIRTRLPDVRYPMQPKLIKQDGLSRMRAGVVLPPGYHYSWFGVLNLQQTKGWEDPELCSKSL